MKKEVMVDIETLGTGPNSICVSMAAQTFTNDGPVGAPLFLPLDMSHQIAVARGGDQDTLLWWFEQALKNPQAIKRSFGRERLHLPDAFGQFLRYAKGAETIWANGPQFDLVILEGVFKGAPWPFGHRTARDMRTLREEAGMPYEWQPEGWVGIDHDPVDDCLFQIAVVLEARRRIRHGVDAGLQEAVVP